MNHIERILSEFPFVVLDGGLATELERMGYNLQSKLWSAKMLAEKPDAIKMIHRSYLDAGADCIITSSYQATVKGFMSSGFSRSKAVNMIRLSYRIAEDSIRDYMDTHSENDRPVPFIASSSGCYGAFLADGSEYRGDYKLTLKEYKDFHGERIDILADAGADFIAFETFPGIEEALAVTELMNDYPEIHYWISFTACDKKHISHGELFSECAEILEGSRNLSAVGINCSNPELISPLLREVRPVVKIPLVIYPNSGEHFDTGSTCWINESGRIDFSRMSEEWYSIGARVIGGCCRTGPDDIKAISSFRKDLLNSKKTE